VLASRHPPPATRLNAVAVFTLSFLVPILLVLQAQDRAPSVGGLVRFVRLQGEYSR
jgi:hypothetical protein